MEMNSEKTLLATIILFMLVLSPAVPSNADGLTRRELGFKEPKCVNCYCCQPDTPPCCVCACAVPFSAAVDQP
ncbi:unnamed protein product [Withania somnifera]